MRIIILTFLLTGMLQILLAQPEAIFNVHFDTDISALSNEAETTILDRTNPISNPEDYRVQLIGHTDRRGSWEYNKALSESRANSVKKRLQMLGFPTEKITWKGLSYDDPIDSKDTEEAWTKNRRVDIIIERANWNVPADYYSVDATQTTVLNYERSGTSIEIPADAFIYKNGKQVEGDVLIYYREFRDFADFMASDLPMNFEKDGEDVYFNSTGMFEIRAYKGDEELSLRPGKNIGLDIVQSQILDETQFWRFNENTGQWEDGASSIVTQSGRWVNTPIDTVSRKVCNTALRIKELKLSKIKSLIPFTVAMIDSSAQYDDRYIPQMDGAKYLNRFNDRYGKYAGMHYVGHLSEDEIKDNPRYYNIKLEKARSIDGDLAFRINDLASENPEIAAFEDAVWTFKKFISKGPIKDENPNSLLTQNWSDIRIYQGQKSKNGKRTRFNRHKPYRIKLKDGDTKVEILAHLETINGQSNEASKKDARLTYKSYSDTFRARRAAFDQSIDKNGMALQGYWTYFKVLIPRHYPLPFDLGNDADACDCFSYVKKYAPKYKPHPCLSFFFDKIVYLEKHFKELENRQMDDETLKQFVSKFNGDITSDQILYEPIYQEFAEDVPRLNLSAMGKFNLDVLKRFKDEEKIFASFEDAEGKNIDFKKVDVINYDLNGLLSFTDPTIYLDLGAPTTIVVYGQDEKLYAINPDDLASLDLKNRRAFTFTVRELKDGVNDPQDLREALAYN